MEFRNHDATESTYRIWKSLFIEINSEFAKEDNDLRVHAGVAVFSSAV